MMRRYVNGRVADGLATRLAGLALTGLVLTGCDPQAMDVMGKLRDAGRGTALATAGTGDAQPGSAVVQPLKQTGASAAEAASPAAATRIMLQRDSLQLLLIKGQDNSYRVLLPPLTALGTQAAEGEALLVAKVQSLASTAGTQAEYNKAKRFFTIKATPEQVDGLTGLLETLRKTLAFARYSLELWSGSVADAATKGTALAVDAPKGEALTARVMDAAAMSQPRLEASGAKRLQADSHLVLLDQPVQVSYTAPVDYIASSSTASGAVNMTVERFPTLLGIQAQTRRMDKGTETTLNLMGKGIARFQEETSNGMTLKVPMPKTFSARVPFMPTAGKAVVVGGLRGLGKPCAQQTAGSPYCPYELSGGIQPQDQSLTLVVRPAIYLAEAAPRPRPAAVAATDGSLQLIAAGEAPVGKTGKSTTSPQSMQEPQPTLPQAQSENDPLMPVITPAPVKPVTVAKSSAAVPEKTVAAALPQPETDATLPTKNTPSLALPKGFAPKAAIAPIAVIRGTPEVDSKKTSTAPVASRETPKSNLFGLMSDKPKGKLVERPMPAMPEGPVVPVSGMAAKPLPKDPTQVDWAAWDAELEASVGDGGAPPPMMEVPMDAAVSPSVVPPAEAKTMQRASGVHVFRGAPGVKISPEAMKRLMELDARQSQAANRPKDNSLLGQLRDKAHLQGVMMVYDKDKKKQP
jgi:hypothetical protein